MSELKLFFWNDDDDELKAWKDVAVTDGYMTPESSTSQNVEEVAAVFTRKRNDFVVLDAMVPDNNPIGLHIAQKIRDIDPLVPIMVATKFPGEFYNAYVQNGKFDEIRLASICHSGVMTAGVFSELAVREAMTRWHRACRQHVLLRTAVRAIDKQFGGPNDIRKRAKRLADSLTQLAFLQSVDSWHSSLGETVQTLLGDSDMPNIKNAYSEIVELFHKADAFYMAAGMSRRHLCHNVSVFLMGTVLLLADTELRRSAIREVHEKQPNISESEALFRALLLWACASTTHDVAYLGENLSRVSKSFVELAAAFKEPLDEILGTSMVTGETIEVEHVHHGNIGAKIWENKTESTCSGVEKYYATLIRSAIKRHDSKATPSPLPQVDEKAWLSFLIVMFDELQDWHRERHDDSSLWDQFELEGIFVEKAMSRVSLSLDFVAQDLPALAQYARGLRGSTDVKKRFKRIIEKLERELSYSDGMTVQLNASFPGRRIGDPVEEAAHLKTATNG